MSDDRSVAGDGSAPEELEDRLDELHENLDGIQALPVERAASRWIGEAEAIARDLAEADLEPAVVEERLEKVESLLAEVEGIGDATADEHLQRAISLTESALTVVETDDGSSQP